MRKILTSVSVLAFALALSAPGVAFAGKSSDKSSYKASDKSSYKASDKSSHKPSAAVPEPSAALAFAAGLGALGLTRRRRSR